MTHRQNLNVAAADPRVGSNKISRRGRLAARPAAEAMQPLERRQMMSASSPSIAYDGSTLELRGPATGGHELRVELDSDASHVRGVVDHQAGEWLRVKKVHNIRIVGGEDRDTVQVDARLANTKLKLSTSGIERLKAVPVLLSPRVRMAQWARLEAEDFGRRLASRLHVKFAGLAELTQAQSIQHVSKKSEPKPIITTALPDAPEPQAEPQAEPQSEPVKAVDEQPQTEPVEAAKPTDEPTEQPAATPAPAPTAPAATPAPTAAPKPSQDNATAPTARINAMTLSIPAGQSVNVDAFATTLRNGQWNDASFEWDFGESGSKFNTLRGFSASHFYGTAGSYDVKLKVTDETGRVGTATAKLTVTKSARTKIYVSATGNDANDGLSSDRPVKTARRGLALLDAVGDHAVLLFQAGQVHNLSASLRVNHDDVVIRSYGTGAKPTLKWTGEPGQSPRMVFNDVGTRLLTVRDLNFDTVGPAGTDKNRATAFGPMGNETTFLNNSVQDVTNAVLLNARPKGTLIQGNEALKATGLRAYFVWGEGETITILGNKAVNSTREHIIRLSGDVGVKGATISGNDFRNMDRRPGDKGGDRYDYDKNVITMQRGSFGYVSDNKLHGPSELGPLGGSDGLNSTAARWDWSIWENNTFDVRELNVLHGARHADIRFNLFEIDDGRDINVQGYADNYGRTAQDITIHGNVAVNNGTKAEFLRVNKGAKQVEVTDNVYIAPNVRFGNWNAAGMSIDDSDLSGFVRISGNTWPSASRGAGWVEGGVNFIAGHGDARDWYSPGEWNALSNVWGERSEDVAAGPLITAVLNRHGVPVTTQAA